MAGVEEAVKEADEKKNWPRATLTAKEASQFLGCSYWQLLEMVKRHEIGAIHIGKRVLFREKTLIEWMDIQEAKSRN